MRRRSRLDELRRSRTNAGPIGTPAGPIGEAEKPAETLAWSGRSDRADTFENFPAARARACVPAHGYNNVSDRPDRPDQASTVAGLSTMGVSDRLRTYRTGLIPVWHCCRYCARPHLSAADAIERPLPGSAWPAWVHASCAVTWAEVLAAGGSHAEASSACWRERDGIERARTGG